MDNKSTKVITGKVRLSYAHLFKPHAVVEGQEAKYSVCLLIPKEDKSTINAIKTAVDSAIKSGASKWDGKTPKGLRTPLRDGDNDDAVDTDKRPEYRNHYFLNVSSKTPPGIIDRYKNPITNSDEVYSGCYARASITFYPYNVSGNKGIAAGLGNIQKLYDGDYLGGRSRAEDDFDEYEDDTEDMSFLG